jgi:putative membrane protein insertion efficiency factor
MKKILLIVLSFYKRVFSSLILFLFGGGCRFSPTCSEYAKGAIEKHGVAKGTLLSVKRLSHCHPFNQAGYDPVP